MSGGYDRGKGLQRVYWHLLNNTSPSSPISTCWVVQRCHIMERLGRGYYRSMVWIAKKLVGEEPLPSEVVNPVSLFEEMIRFKRPTWGQYVCFLCWMNSHFPHNGDTVFIYLKKTYPSYHYSFTYLLTQWGLYHGFKSLLALHRPFGIWVLRWCERVCPSS